MLDLAQVKLNQKYLWYNVDCHKIHFTLAHLFLYSESEWGQSVKC